MNQPLLQEAEDFILTCYRELNKTEKEINQRINNIQNDIKKPNYFRQKQPYIND